MFRHDPPLVVPALAFVLTTLTPAARPAAAAPPSPTIDHGRDGSTFITLPRFGGHIDLRPGGSWSLHRVRGSADTELVDTRPEGKLWIVPERLDGSCAGRHAGVPTPDFVPRGYAPTMTVGPDGDLVCADTKLGTLGVLFGASGPLDDGARAVLHDALDALLAPNPCPVGAECDPTDPGASHDHRDATRTFPHGGKVDLPGLHTTVTLPPGSWSVTAIGEDGYMLTGDGPRGEIQVISSYVTGACAFDKLALGDGQRIVPTPRFLPPGFEPTMVQFGDPANTLLCAETPRGSLTVAYSTNFALDAATRTLIANLAAQILAGGSTR